MVVLTRCMLASCDSVYNSLLQHKLFHDCTFSSIAHVHDAWGCCFPSVWWIIQNLLCSSHSVATGSDYLLPYISEGDQKFELLCQCFQKPGDVCSPLYFLKYNRWPFPIVTESTSKVINMLYSWIGWYRTFTEIFMWNYIEVLSFAWVHSNIRCKLLMQLMFSFAMEQYTTEMKITHHPQTPSKGQKYP